MSVECNFICRYCVSTLLLILVSGREHRSTGLLLSSPSPSLLASQRSHAFILFIISYIYYIIYYIY
jgi:hypothetical protein